jgi:hypothetical protein
VEMLLKEAFKNVNRHGCSVSPGKFGAGLKITLRGTSRVNRRWWE